MANENHQNLPKHYKNVWRFHVLALATSIVWSTTFVSTKLLLQAGLSPEAIFLYRFSIAYLCIVFIARQRLFADSLKDEFILFMAGLTGGSLYFLAENTALRHTYASNVSILISTTPLLTMALSSAIFRKPLRKSMFGGSILAMAGVTLVVFNGDASFKTAPMGDILVMAAAMCWAVYSVILKYLGLRKYHVLFITRKVFFYGLVSMALYFPFSGQDLHLNLLTDTLVAGNILFLGLIASLACFLAWNRIVEAIGPDKASNYIYLSPVGTITTAMIFLHEPVSWMAIAGAVVTISGVIIVEKLP